MGRGPPGRKFKDNRGRWGGNSAARTPVRLTAMDYSAPGPRLKHTWLVTMPANRRAESSKFRRRRLSGSCPTASARSSIHRGIETHRPASETARKPGHCGRGAVACRILAWHKIHDRPARSGRAGRIRRHTAPRSVRHLCRPRKKGIAEVAEVTGSRHVITNNSEASQCEPAGFLTNVLCHAITAFNRPLVSKFGSNPPLHHWAAR
jgi:hypothetical protein